MKALEQAVPAEHESVQQIPPLGVGSVCGKLST